VGDDAVAGGAAGGVGDCREDVLTLLRLWWRRREQRDELLQDKVLRELRRAAYFSGEVPVCLSAAVLAQRLGVTSSQLHPLMDRLVEQRLISDLTPRTYGVREGPLVGGGEERR
jgi:hypothetical protein